MGRMALTKNDCILLGKWILHLLLIHAQSISWSVSVADRGSRHTGSRGRAVGGYSGRGSGDLGTASLFRVDDS